MGQCNRQHTWRTIPVLGPGCRNAADCIGGQGRRKTHRRHGRAGQSWREHFDVDDIGPVWPTLFFCILWLLTIDILYKFCNPDLTPPPPSTTTCLLFICIYTDMMQFAHPYIIYPYI